MSDNTMRLNRYLASAGFGSRRSCEELIRSGKVRVNGVICADLSTRIAPGDEVRVDGRAAAPRDALHVALHKPPGVLCTASDEKNRATIYSLLPQKWRTLKYAGRLDKESEGLMILSSDGKLIQRLTHPRHQCEKEYRVILSQPLNPELIPKLKKGFWIPGGMARMHDVRIESPNVVRVVLRQGIKRQIRLMFAKFDYEVKRLIRLRIGNIELGNLPAGAYRLLRDQEVDRAFQAR